MSEEDEAPPMVPATHRPEDLARIDRMLTPRGDTTRSHYLLQVEADEAQAAAEHEAGDDEIDCDLDADVPEQDPLVQEQQDEIQREALQNDDDTTPDTETEQR